MGQLRHSAYLWTRHIRRRARLRLCADGSAGRADPAQGGDRPWPSAEYFGAGTDNANVASDIQIRTYGIPDRAARWLETGGERQRQICRGFVDGANEYADRNPSDIDPSFRQVLPLQPEDALAIFQLTVHFNFMPEQSGVPELLAMWQQGQATAASSTGKAARTDGRSPRRSRPTATRS